MIEGIFRVASCVPDVTVANTIANSHAIINLAQKAYKAGAHMAAFPELCITAYTCGDLFHNDALLQGAISGLHKIAKATAELPMMIVVGLPLRTAGKLANCAVVLYQGSILGITVKKYIPNYNEFYEKRWWKSSADFTGLVSFDGIDGLYDVAGPHLFRLAGVNIGIEICEDLWVPVPPSCHLAMGGADIIVNLSASDDLIGKYAYLRSLIAQQSARCICGYVYAGAGYGESSTDLVFDGKAIIAENGSIVAANKRWQSGKQMVMADIDVLALRRDRMHMGSYADCAKCENVVMPTITAADDSALTSVDELLRPANPRPFVPATDDAMAERCSEIINIQVAGLAKRLQHIHAKTLVIGISGGLDSTLALMVAVAAFHRLGLDRKGIIGITMPGFGTTKRTKSNAMTLMKELGITIRVIPIADAVNQHFRDIGHDPAVHDVTYENCQARERTQILMDVANHVGGIVLGTGDLSELALGWATYNGDHMSMYGVNVSIPKTLVKYLVRHFAISTDNKTVRATLLDISDTPISPELIPADDKGNIVQKTEDLVGPYDLHDFFLYYTLRYGFSPRRIFMLARQAFAGQFDPETILKWEKTFFRRFFAQQFKRSCLPDGPKVGSVCLSPRGDWRMPSDASAQLWLDDLDFDPNIP